MLIPSTEENAFWLRRSFVRTAPTDSGSIRSMRPRGLSVTAEIGPRLTDAVEDFGNRTLSWEFGSALRGGKPIAPQLV